MLVSTMLKTGKENAISGADLCQILGIPIRILARTIEQERRDGAPICASMGSPYGYYLAANQKEMDDYCASLRKRAGEIFRTRRACLKSKEKLPTE